MAERREKGRAEIGALPEELRFLALGEELHPLDRNGRKACNGVERAGAQCFGGRGQKTDRLHAEPQRHERNGVAEARVSDPGVTAVGPLTRVELQGPARAGERLVQLRRLDDDVPFAALVNVPAPLTGQTNGDAPQVEPARDVPGERVERAARLAREEDVAAEVEEPGRLVAALDRIAGPRLGGCGELTGDDRCRQERARATQLRGSAMVSVPTGSRK